jgi:hypothetical protein
MRAVGLHTWLVVPPFLAVLTSTIDTPHATLSVVYEGRLLVCGKG